jgi:hypothetical protein
MRALIAAYPRAHDVEIASGGLEQAFLELTGSEEAIPVPPTKEGRAA